VERTGVIALAGLDGEAFTGGTDFDLVIVAVAIVAARHVRQSVLVASLFSYSRIELFHGGTLDGVIDVATGIVRVIDQAGELSLSGVADSQAVYGDIVVEESLESVRIRVTVKLGSIETI